jgi:aryl-alcohol dehydrogenase-like predicted oxidoreductase
MNQRSTSPARRDFLKQLGLAGAGILLSGQAQAAEGPKAITASDRIPRRKFGRYDFTVSALCLGGHTLRVANDEEARKIVDLALERGLDFFDNSWDYHNGAAEELQGKLLEGRRDKVFLMTKVCSNHKGGGKARAMQMLEDSLRRLRTDHLDLWQLHELVSMEQVESAYAPGGTLEALTEAKKQGKVRFIGFTGHGRAEVHLAMLSRGFTFDACQMPVNAADNHDGKNFREKVMPELVKQGIAPLAMKTMWGNAAPIREGKLTVEEALRYALSAPVATLVTGVKAASELEQNIKIATSFVPMSPTQLSQIEQRFAPEAVEHDYAYYAHPDYRDGRGHSQLS